MIKDEILKIEGTTKGIKGIRKYGNLESNVSEILKSEDDAILIIKFDNSVIYRRFKNIGSSLTK